jgi:predicted nucleotidyltransferase
MRLSDDQIAKWSMRGDPIHAWFSYEMVRETLASASLDGMSYVIYPQGSYANKTNIAADSDVDIVIALKSAFYPNKEGLNEREIEEYRKYYQESDLTWHRFREIVVGMLRSNYFIQERTKCVKVRSNLIRLPADVLIALDYRHYTSFPSFFEQTFVDGVQFYTSDNTKIINYPKRHIRACARKDNRVAGRYRRIVRVAKNARNALIADDETQVRAGAAPSYFLESLLWNVPDHCYRHDLSQAYREVIGWLYENSGQLKSMNFPNEMAKLFGDAQDAVWNESEALTIINAIYLQLNL